MSLGKLKIAHRLIIGFGIPLIAMLFLGLHSIQDINRLSGMVIDLYEHPFKVSRAIGSIQRDIIAMHRSMKDVALAQNQAEIDDLVFEVSHLEQEVYKNFKTIQKKFLGEKYDVIVAIQTFRDWKAIRDTVIRLSEQGQKAKAADITKGKGAQHVELLEAKVDIMATFAKGKAASFIDSTMKAKDDILIHIIAFLGAGLLVGIVVSVLIARSITLPLKLGTNWVQEIETGNLRKETRYRGADEISMLFTSINNLLDTLSDISLFVHKVSAGNFQAEMQPRSSNDHLRIGLSNMVRSLKKTSKLMENIADGNSDVNMEQTGTQVFFANSMVQIIETFKEINLLAEQVSMGDYSTKTVPKSEKDQLSLALQKMVANLNQVSELIKAVAEGNYNIPIEPKGRQDVLTHSLVIIVNQLKEKKEELRIQTWFQEGQYRLNREIQGVLDELTLSKKIITFLSKYIQAHNGAFYIHDAGLGELQMTASYALKGRKGLSHRTPVGVGLVGQAALEKETILVGNLPEDYTQVCSSLGEAIPKNLLLLPLVTNEKLFGVMEFSSLKEFPPETLRFLDSITENIAIAVNSSINQKRLKAVLEEKGK